MKRYEVLKMTVDDALVFVMKKARCSVCELFEVCKYAQSNQPAQVCAQLRAEYLMENITPCLK